MRSKLTSTGTSKYRVRSGSLANEYVSSMTSRGTSLEPSLAMAVYL